MHVTLRMQSASQHGRCQHHLRHKHCMLCAMLMAEVRLQTEQHLQQLLEHPRPHLHEGLKLFQRQLLVIIQVCHGQNPVPELLC